MIEKLTARRLATIKAPGKYGDGRGLWLIVRPNGRRGWVFRYRFRGRDREMGLGGQEVSLKEARQSAARARQLIREGLDPIEKRRKARAKAMAPTFRESAEQRPWTAAGGRRLEQRLVEKRKELRGKIQSANARDAERAKSGKRSIFKW